MARHFLPGRLAHQIDGIPVGGQAGRPQSTATHAHEIVEGVQLCGMEEPMRDCPASANLQLPCTALPPPPPPPLPHQKPRCMILSAGFSARPWLKACAYEQQQQQQL